MGIVLYNVFVGAFGSLVSAYRLFVVGTCHRSRPPSDQFASAVRSDCVRHPIRLRPVSDAKISTTTALTLRLLFANTHSELSKRK